MTTSAGTCFGFRVSSPLPFHYLREGEGEALRVEADGGQEAGADDRLVVQWGPNPELRFHARLYEGAGAYRLWIEDAGWFLVDLEGARITVPLSDDPLRREERLWSIPALLFFTARGALALHAAAVETDGGALLLAAPRTFGKTTLAAGFWREGHRVLSEDLACIRTAPEPAVVPGPAMLRLRNDVAERLELQEARSLAVDDERTHLALGGARRGDCDPVPLRGIVLLRPSEEEPRLKRVAPGEALRDLWAVAFRFPTEEGRARCFAQVAALADAVPIWNLTHPLNLDSLSGTVRYVARHV
ncbi:MAG: hypothetical protein ACRDOP_13075 [Gaiellaceae bacterium]